MAWGWFKSKDSERENSQPEHQDQSRPIVIASFEILGLEDLMHRIDQDQAKATYTDLVGRFRSSVESYEGTVESVQGPRFRAFWMNKRNDRDCEYAINCAVKISQLTQRINETELKDANLVLTAGVEFDETLLLAESNGSQKSYSLIGSASEEADLLRQVPAEGDVRIFVSKKVLYEVPGKFLIEKKGTLGLKNPPKGAYFQVKGYQDVSGNDVFFSNHSDAKRSPLPRPTESDRSAPSAHEPMSAPSHRPAASAPTVIPAATRSLKAAKPSAPPPRKEPSHQFEKTTDEEWLNQAAASSNRLNPSPAGDAPQAKPRPTLKPAKPAPAASVTNTEANIAPAPEPQAPINIDYPTLEPAPTVEEMEALAARLDAEQRGAA